MLQNGLKELCANFGVLQIRNKEGNLPGTYPHGLSEVNKFQAR